MTDKKTVQDFLAQKTIAVVGVSRSGKKFGNMAYRELKSKGYQVYPVHPSAEQVEGDRAYPNLAALPEKPGGVLVIVLSRAIGNCRSRGCQGRHPARLAAARRRIPSRDPIL